MAYLADFVEAPEPFRARLRPIRNPSADDNPKLGAESRVARRHHTQMTPTMRRAPRFESFLWQVIPHGAAFVHLGPAAPCFAGSDCMFAATLASRRAPGSGLHPVNECGARS